MSGAFRSLVEAVPRPCAGPVPSGRSPALRLLTRALVAALVCVAMFALEAATIASGRDPFGDPVVALFFFAGLAALLVTSVLTGAALALGVVGSALVAVVATAVLRSGLLGVGRGRPLGDRPAHPVRGAAAAGEAGRPARSGGRRPPA
ncbi:hypothetical protein GCM10009616_24050 [Microlunatus lacustris]